MPKYSYTARSQSGELKSGIMEAKSEQELSRLLRQEGYFLIKAESEEDKNKKRFKISLPFFNRVGLKEKMFFTRNLRVMVVSGIALPRAVKVLSEQTTNKKFKRILTSIAKDLTKGQSFSQSLSYYPNVFSELFQNMIKVGEETGTLEEVLRVLSEQMEKEHELRSKVVSAMVYPAIIVTAMVGIGILMLVIVIPKLAQTFKELGVELPLTTRIVIFLGTFLAQKWYLFLLIIIIVLFLFRMALKSNRGKKILASFALKIPIISTLVKKTNTAIFARNISSLIMAGVSIVRSLEIISTTLGNLYFKEAVKETAEKVRKGEKMAQALKSYQNLFPSLVLEMIEIGEETGETSSILAKLADFYEEEVAVTTKNLSAVVEPLLMILIGATVAFFAISMIQPMYSMLQAIQ
jgi:type IV pilus assembly protein PilC